MEWNLFRRHKKPANGPSHLPDWVVEKKRFAKELAQNHSFEPVEDEIRPPWIEHPEILAGSIGWRMGVGETYIHEVFIPFWQSLSSIEQAGYVEKFDLGSSWPDRDRWLASLETNKSLL